MQIDELRGELTSLADEIPPFEGDVRQLHRRARRRRVVGSAVAVALAVVVAVSTVAIARHDNGRARIAAGPDKEVSPDQITHVDAIVVPATPVVKAALDASPLVTKYARVPQSDRWKLQPPSDGLCALGTSDGYAVDGVAPGANFAEDLTRLLRGQARVLDQSDRFSADLEVFMKVTASSHDVQSVQTALNADPDILSVRHLSKADAYAVFKREFADQPDLVKSTKASGLPESFRVILKSGRSVSAVVLRYQGLAGVDSAITLFRGLFDPSLLPIPSQTATACTNG